MKQPLPPPEDEEDEEDEEDMDEFDEGVDMFDALGSLLATEDGDTVAMSLQNLAGSAEKIAHGIEMQNKILVKILSAMSKPSACPCVYAPAKVVEDADAA
jgi:hypothetical protein